MATANKKEGPISSSRHKEYAVGVAILAVPILWVFRSTDSIILLFSINLLALVVILLSAFSVIRHADVFAHRLGEPYGSLILSLSVVVLEVSLISALMATGKATPTLMRDTLYSLIMLVISGFVGVSLLIGGRKFVTQHVNLAGITQYLTTIIPLAILVLILPATLENNTFSNSQLIVAAILSASLYAVFLIIQTKTHQNLFIYEHEDTGDKPGHGKPSPYSNAWHGLWLIIHLLCVVVITKIDAEPLGMLMGRLNAPVGLTGFIVALLIFSPEGLGAIRAVLANDLQKAMNMYFGSVLATISLTVPAVVGIALLTNQDVVLGLSPPDIVILMGVFILCLATFASGRTNKLDGAAHLVIFGAYFMMLLR